MYMQKLERFVSHCLKIRQSADESWFSHLLIVTRASGVTSLSWGRLGRIPGLLARWFNVFPMASLLVLPISYCSEKDATGPGKCPFVAHRTILRQWSVQCYPILRQWFNIRSVWVCPSVIRFYVFSRITQISMFHLYFATLHGLVSYFFSLRTDFKSQPCWG